MHTRNIMYTQHFVLPSMVMVCVWLAVIIVAFSAKTSAAPEIGASLYIAPLSENPRAGGNFTAIVKVDSLSKPVNAVKGVLAFNKERVEVINVSKIGSVVNLWVEEPRFSNIDGTIRFQGGIPGQGFIGNGGNVLYVIFRAKTTGSTSLVWKEGEVLASDGKGTNVLIDLQNLDFFVDEAVGPSGSGGGINGTLLISNVVLLIMLLIVGVSFAGKFLIKYHDRSFHHHKHHEE